MRVAVLGTEITMLADGPAVAAVVPDLERFERVAEFGHRDEEQRARRVASRATP
jgi:hypothetical protein